MSRQELLTFATAIVPVPCVDTLFTTIVAPVGTVATPPLTFTAFPATPVNVCIGSNELKMMPSPGTDHGSSLAGQIPGKPQPGPEILMVGVI